MQRFFKDRKKDADKDKKSVEIAIPSVLWDISSVENVEIFNHGIKFLTHCTDYLRKTNGMGELDNSCLLISYHPSGNFPSSW
jgi:hypothetical protein